MADWMAATMVLVMGCLTVGLRVDAMADRLEIQLELLSVWKVVLMLDSLLVG